jgi:putative hydrolase of the HAD superfamily
MHKDFSHIDTWMFDLDNTLYHPRHDLFAQIDVKMGQYIQNLLNVDAVEARRVQKSFFLEHGTTLRGLMANHDIEPHGFLDFVHDIDVSVVPPEPALAEALIALPGRKLIFTNGDRAYARRVLAQLGIDHIFEGIHCIIDAGFEPKPQPDVYNLVTQAFALEADKTIFFEDMARNLKPAKELGWKTVWIDNGSEWGNIDAGDFIDVTVSDLTPWLNGLTRN